MYMEWKKDIYKRDHTDLTVVYKVDPYTQNNSTYPNWQDSYPKQMMFVFGFL